MYRRILAGCLPVLALTTALAAPAQAATRYGCNYPYVCFYLTATDWQNAHPTATFRDMGYWQNLGSRSRGSFMVYNSRNDDGALVRYANSNGRTECVTPNLNMDVGHNGVVEAVIILDNPWC